jgi:hypothetical protein
MNPTPRIHSILPAALMLLAATLPANADPSTTTSDPAPAVTPAPTFDAVVPGPIDLGTMLVGTGMSTTVRIGHLAGQAGESMRWTWLAPVGWNLPGGVRTVDPGASVNEPVMLDTSVPAVRNGALILRSDSPDGMTRTIPVSATVLAHAVPSLSSDAVLTERELVLSGHTNSGQPSAKLQLHNLASNLLSARVFVWSAAIEGGEGRFRLVGPTHRFVAEVPAEYTVVFDGDGAQPGTEHTATLTLMAGDEPLPGAAPAVPLTVTLKARPSAAYTAELIGSAKPTTTRLRSPEHGEHKGERVLRFDLAKAGRTHLELFDAKGRRVAGLIQTRHLKPGRYAVRWNGRGESGNRLAAGRYTARLQAHGVTRTVAVAIGR